MTHVSLSDPIFSELAGKGGCRGWESVTSCFISLLSVEPLRFIPHPCLASLRPELLRFHASNLICPLEPFAEIVKLKNQPQPMQIKIQIRNSGGGDSL